MSEHSPDMAHSKVRPYEPPAAEERYLEFVDEGSGSVIPLPNKSKSSKKTHPLFVERLADGKYQVGRSGTSRASVTVDTQREAIEWAKSHTNGVVHVERVRHSDGSNPQKWRKP